MQTQLPRHDVLLLGIGHTNAHILRMWKMRPYPEARLTCLSNFSTATYSGMLPGVLAGQYPRDRMEIDLVRLCASAGAQLITDEVVGLDRQARRVLFADRPPISYDVLSIGIGSTPTYDGVHVEDWNSLLPIKPMQTFLQRLEEQLIRVASRVTQRPLQLAVVGAGAGGVEVAFCLSRRVQQTLGTQAFELSLVDAGTRILGQAAARTERLARDALHQRGVKLFLGQPVVRVGREGIALRDGKQLKTDIVLWATRAAAPPLLAQCNLPTDDRGFLLTRSTLQTVGDDRIFAVGDSGTLADQPTPKAGVYAVRQAPILWENLARVLEHRPLREYRPQRGFLKLLNTGDGRAIGEYRGIALHQRWLWSLKDYIDGRFMDKYQDYRRPAMSAAAPVAANSAAPRCAGCGGKISGSVLSQALSQLEIPASEHVLLGLETPDDAAVIRPPGGRPLTVTVDFFAAPLDDPYLVGRLAALNSASDCFSMGAQPLAALAMATLPPGPARQQAQLLEELLAGGLHEFRRMPASLVGGHTIEGPQVTLGFTMLADQGSGPLRTKCDLRAGDCLVLTKPLGTGVLLAAHMQARCHARWMKSLLDSMLISNQQVVPLLDEFRILGLTDVTGFGLAGHLLEMLRASRLGAKLKLAYIPLLPGTGELLEAGVQSTLAPANRAAEADMLVDESCRKHPTYAALFDPQTCGGLLLGVREEHVNELLDRLRAEGLPAAWIGKTTPWREGPRLLVR